MGNGRNNHELEGILKLHADLLDWTKVGVDAKELGCCAHQ